jgi:hypothetical protein
MAFQYLYLHVISRPSDMTSLSDLELLCSSVAYFRTNNMSNSPQSPDIAGLLSTMFDAATDKVNGVTAGSAAQLRTTTSSATPSPLDHTPNSSDFDVLSYSNQPMGAMGAMGYMGYMPTYDAAGSGVDEGWWGFNFFPEL